MVDRKRDNLHLDEKLTFPPKKRKKEKTKRKTLPNLTERCDKMLKKGKEDCDARENKKQPFLLVPDGLDETESKEIVEVLNQRWRKKKCTPSLVDAIFGGKINEVINSDRFKEYRRGVLETTQKVMVNDEIAGCPPFDTAKTPTGDKQNGRKSPRYIGKLEKRIGKEVSQNMRKNASKVRKIFINEKQICREMIAGSDLVRMNRKELIFAGRKDDPSPTKEEEHSPRLDNGDSTTSTAPANGGNDGKSGRSMGVALDHPWSQGLCLANQQKTRSIFFCSDDEKEEEDDDDDDEDRDEDEKEKGVAERQDDGARDDANQERGKQMSEDEEAISDTREKLEIRNVDTKNGPSLPIYENYGDVGGTNEKHDFEREGNKNNNNNNNDNGHDYDYDYDESHPVFRTIDTTLSSSSTNITDTTTTTTTTTTATASISSRSPPPLSSSSSLPPPCSLSTLTATSLSGIGGNIKSISDYFANNNSITEKNHSSILAKVIMKETAGTDNCNYLRRALAENPQNVLPAHPLPFYSKFDVSDIRTRTREEEEHDLREPEGDERPCVKGELCQGRMGNIPLAEPVVLKEVCWPEDIIRFKATGVWPRERQTCVLCERVRFQYMYSNGVGNWDVSNPGMDYPIQRWKNFSGIKGEYSRSDVYHFSGEYHRKVFGPMVIYFSSNYRQRTNPTTGKKYFEQWGYVKPYSDDDSVFRSGSNPSSTTNRN
jgi:hypothetical protein